MVNPALLQQVLDLPVEDRTELFYELGATLDAVSISPELEAVLRARAAEAVAHPESSQPWDEVMADLRARYAR